MTIDGKSFVIGAFAGYCLLLLRATAEVSRNYVKKSKEDNTESKVILKEEA